MQSKEIEAEKFMREYIGEYYDRIVEHYRYSLPDRALKFDSVDQLKRKVTASGSHFFDRAAMRFFDSRIIDQLWGQRFFVTSESDGDNPRRYTVRYVYEHEGRLTVEDLGGFQRFKTLDSAKMAAQQAAALL